MAKYPSCCRQQFQMHFLGRKVDILIQISLKFIPKDVTDHMSVLVQVQWNLYNKTGKLLTKTHKIYHLCGTVFTKACLFSLSWETTCLERPQYLVVVLYSFHCNDFAPSRQQSITWTSVDQALWCHMASLKFNELIHCSDASFALILLIINALFNTLWPRDAICAIYIYMYMGN